MIRPTVNEAVWRDFTLSFYPFRTARASSGSRRFREAKGINHGKSF